MYVAGTPHAAFQIAELVDTNSANVRAVPCGRVYVVRYFLLSSAPPAPSA
jgi:hypothetical protein